MRVSWLFVIGLLLLVSVFSVQNAEPITVRFFPWEFQMSSALVIQLAAILGALVGLSVGALSRRPSRDRTVLPTPTPPSEPVAPAVATPAVEPAEWPEKDKLSEPKGSSAMTHRQGRIGDR